MKDTEDTNKYHRVNNDEMVQGQIIGDNSTVHQHFYGPGSKTTSSIKSKNKFYIPISPNSRINLITGKLLLLISIAVLVLLILLAVFRNISLFPVPNGHLPVSSTIPQPVRSPSTSQPIASSIINPKNTYVADMQHLLLFNPLQNNSVEGQWDEGGSITTSGTCKFEQQSYQLVPLPLSEGLACYAEAPKLTLTNFTYEAKITFQQGSSAGLAFCSQGSYPAKEYRFLIQTDGNYKLAVTNDQGAITLKNGKSDAIHADQANLLAVVVDRGNIGLYVDHQLLNQTSDTTYTQGRIGFYTPESPSTDSIIAASTTNVTVWSR